MKLTVIVPATNDPATLPRCLAAITAAAEPPEQVIVVKDPKIRHPALARNAGVREASGDLLVFVDADVTVHADAFHRIRRAFEADPELAALFGSYDDTPDSPATVSAFRNLLHHHVHQCNAGPAGTFWAGLGAMRREAFEAMGGFAVHPIEDIELGMRLSRTGARILLDPTVQGKHLKHWDLFSMVRTDLLVRGIPWVGLLLEHRGSSSASSLNLSWRHRLSALASLTGFLTLLLGWLWIALTALAVLVALNLEFYRLLARRQGVLRAVAGVGLHVVHHLVSVAAVPLGILAHLKRRRQPAAAPT
jgi:glycosyltransferase involved in cell wall biosynthesis